MVCFVAATILLIHGGPPIGDLPDKQDASGSLYRTYFGHPTGENGFEEYFQAADLLNTPAYRAYRQFASWVDRRAASGGQAAGPAPDGSLPPELSLESTSLDARRAWVKPFGKVLDLVNAGNLKPGADPRADEVGMAVRSMTPLTEVGVYLSTLAYVDRADGKYGAAADDLLATLEYGEALGGQSILHTLSGFAIQIGAFEEFADFVGQIPEQACSKIVTFVDRYLSAKPIIVKTIESDRNALTGRIQRLLDPKSIVSSAAVSEDERGPVSVLAAQTQAEREALGRNVRARMNRIYDDLLKTAAGPESQWPSGRQNLAEPTPPAAQAVKTADDLADYIVAQWAPSHSSYLLNAARVRTQMRLLGLYARVERFRWQHHSLPARLSQVAEPSAIVDPLSGKEFQYRILSGGYRLFSLGNESLGEIDLNYRVPHKDAEGPPPFTDPMSGRNR